MRSNIAWTWPSGRVPVRAASEGISGSGSAAAVRALLRVGAGATGLLLGSAQGREELHERRLLLLRQAGEGRHRRRRVLQRAQDRARKQLVADVGEVRPWTVIAVLADLVAGEAARLGHHQLARLEVARHGHIDLVRRSGRRAEV